MQNAIEITNLSKFYKSERILDNLNLNIKKGSIFGLLGPNGAGKTTLVSILNYLTPKNSGNVQILGFNLENHKNKIKSFSSYVPQTYAFYPKLTSYENLEFFGALYGLKSKKLKAGIEYAINITSLEKYANKQTYTYSGGVKRRLNIAIGLLNNPQILYLDEPTVGIDPQSRNHILQTIKNINRDKKITIIYTSHYMEEIEFLCDDIAILDNSKIILHKTKEELISKHISARIKFDNKQVKTVNSNNGYEQFIDELVAIRENKETIKDIKFKQNTLEEMFLNLTKQDLRD